jgi:hypothetical protein
LPPLQNHGLDTEEDWPYTGAEEPMGCDERKKLRNRVGSVVVHLQLQRMCLQLLSGFAS